MNTPNRAAAGLYGAVWRWHFYAGLFVAPFLVLLAITGALYLFNHEIEERWYDHLQRVTPAGAAQPAEVQEQAVLAAYPGASIRSLQWPRTPTLATQWGLFSVDGQSLTVFVDPYRAEVLGALHNNWRLMNVVSSLHGELMAGWLGDRLIELAACWAFVLLVTGLYLWWPRGAGVMGTLLPRLGAKGWLRRGEACSANRTFWRDLHAVPAFWNALLVAFLILSGLPWSGFWGDQLAQLGTLSSATAPTPNFRSAPESPSVSPQHRVQAGHQHGAGEETEALPWTIHHAGQPESGPPGARIGIAQVLEQVPLRELQGPRLRLFYPANARGVFTVSHVPSQAQGQRTLYIDQYSGALIDDIGWDRYSPLGKAVEWSVMAHMGRQFGLANQLLGLLVCLLTVLTAVTGLVMWWKRRPAGKLGAPSLPRSYRTTATVALVTLALSVLFPLVGLSLAVVLALDYGLRRLARPTF